MLFFIKAMRKFLGRAVMPSESQARGPEALCALEENWQTELSAFEASMDAKHLQAAGDSLFQAINRIYGELAAVVAFQAGGWPRPWKRSYSYPPANVTRPGTIQFCLRC
ncbi:MAG TPA: hypothetical protein PLD53_00625 [Candidatus Propionivibrio aalborgensis]|nr:hypothetical protein [Candidatus Propionivibrio aalborgensis]